MNSLFNTDYYSIAEMPVGNFLRVFARSLPRNNAHFLGNSTEISVSEQVLHVFGEIGLG